VECGAVYTTPEDSCAVRFAHLLALDHGRQEPWGSRHGQAFAAFALQHPSQYAASLDQAWAALHRIYVDGTAPRAVFDALRAVKGRAAPPWSTPSRLTVPRHLPAVNISHLGDFAADGYPAALDAWCMAALAIWRGE
jgi:hypothetical protein